MNRHALVLLVVVSVVPACSKKAKPVEKDPAKPDVTATTPPATTPTAPPAAAPIKGTAIEATFEGKKYKFVSAKIYSAGADALQLSTAAPGCDTEYKEGDVELMVHIGQGPGGKRWSPGPLAASFSITSEKDKLATSFVKALLNINPGEWKVGGKVTGTVRISDAETQDGKTLTYTGTGSFEAEVCGLNAPNFEDQALPEVADKGPVTGTLGDVKFAFKSGIAVLSHNDDLQADRIQEIHLFDTAVDCSTWRSQKGPRIKLYGETGAEGKDVLIGTPQMRQVFFMKEDKQTQLVGPAWIKFDALELKEGSELKGSVHGEAAHDKVKEDPTSAGKLSGTFTARVCKQ